MDNRYIFKRLEKKYLIDVEQMKLLAELISKHLPPDIHGESTVLNIYYDTDDFRIIRDSLRKPVYKEKLRLRSYNVPVKSSLVFAEIKKKYKGVVYKRRIQGNCSSLEKFLLEDNYKLHGSESPFDAQIRREIRQFLSFYKPSPKVFISYDRMAFGEDTGLRVTFDRNLFFRTDDLSLMEGAKGKRIIPKDQVIMEVKTEGAVPLWLVHFLSENKIYPTSFSKYGTCYSKFILNDQVSKSG
ncbi:MAG: polyphosphate polymerase domain-containing protein [Lachnospiraceae bacterium]|nr:polyphosphate polymerase domain-containing protein [Lachnospiraceae bacterium]